MKLVFPSFFTLFLITFSAIAQSKKSNPSKSDALCCCAEETMSCVSNKPIKTVGVTFDFKTKNMAFDDDIGNLRRGDAIRIKVVNYNPFLYNVIINSTDSSVYAMNDTGNLLSWFLNPSSLSSITANLLASPMTVPPTVGKKGISGLTEIAEINLSIKNNATFSVNKLLAEQQQRILKIQKSLDAFKNEIDDSLYAWSKLLRIKSKINVSCNDFKIVNSESIISIEKKFKSFRDILQVKHTEIDTSQENYINTTSQSSYAEVIKKTIDSVPDSYIKKFYSRAIDYLNKLDSVINIKNLQVLTETLENMQNYKSCFSSLPVFFTRDIKPVTVQIKPWKDSLGLQQYSTSFEIPWKQKQIWGISGGIYGAMLYNDIYTPKQGVIPDTSYSLVKDNGSKAELGIDALAYTAWEWTKDKDNLAYTGIALGAGLPFTSKPKPRVLLGWTNIWGSNNRAMLTIGMIGGPVERISSAYNTTDTYAIKPDGYMKDVLKVSGFVSFNYSFLSK